MKKILDSKFLFILGLSILVLIGLGIGAFYLFDNSDNYFVKSGYVINPLSSKTEKYFFEEETSYRENLSSMIEFKDVDNNNVAILKDSFLHYNDGGMSFLKKGAILDLNSINGKDAVAFYNITNESIIEKNNDNYVIKTSTNDIKLKNFIGRINDDKYIVTGNLELKIPGNNTTVKGDYFEIVYSENGIVDIENKENKYQVTAEGTYIYAGDILIDLGNKKITKKNEDIMSITAITIDGDENIEIIPKVKEEPTTKASGNGTGEGNGQGGNSGNNDNTDNNNPNGGTGTAQKENSLKVSISDAKVTSTDITLKFDIENDVVTDNFSLRVTNLENGTVVKKYDNIEAGRPYTVPFLNPSTKYLFTIVNESDNSKYVQKMYETSPLGISIEKDYATENKLGYLITVDANSEVTYAKMFLKKFDEETGKTETVKDSEGNDRVIELKNIEPGRTYEKFFNELESDSIYTVVLTDFKVPPYSLGSDDEESSYKLAVTAMTLKKLPDFGNVNLTKDKTESKFKFAIFDIIDEDNAIVSYTYLIYHYETTEIPDPENEENTMITKKLVQSWPAIVKNNASPIEIPVGEGPDKLSNEPKYYYKIVIEYFDNEKILEYIINDNDGFEMEKEPLIKIEPNKEDTSYNRIVGTIYLNDNSCLLSNTDNGECSATRNATIQIIDDQTGASDDITNDNINNAIIVATKSVTFTPVNGRLQTVIDVGNLEENKFYTIRVKANRTDMPNSGPVKIEYADGVKGIQTKTLSTFYIDWHDLTGDRQDVVNITSQFIADNSNEQEREESALAIKRVEISLYEGDVSTEIIENGGISPIIDPEVKLYINNFDIKKSFYDNSYRIGSNETFGLNFESLASKSTHGKIQKNYTVYIKAYYDEGGTKPITISNKSHSYRVDDALLREDIGEMSIKATPIKQGNDGPYTYLDSDTVIGYNILATWQIDKLLAASFEPKKVRIYVVDKNNPTTQVKFYIPGEENPRTEIYENIGVSSLATVAIYMDYGSEISDDIMRRGNDYYIGFEIEAMSTSGDNVGNISTLPINDSGIPKPRGKFTLVGEPKETPKLKMYPYKTNASSAIYSYEISDPDNALYRENTTADYELYYDINGTETAIQITDDKKNTVNYNYFKGQITIPNLNKDDYYAIYLKTKDKDNNALKFPNVTENTQRLFEGEYQAENYNFNFDIINNELADNRVKIKILADDKLLNRIVNYKLTFTTKKNNGEIDKTKDFIFGKLSSCGGASAEVRCLIVDYDTLRQEGMKSTASSQKEIAVSAEIMYDNGFTGYGYIIGNSASADYKYIIMQDNNTKTASGQLIILNSSFNPVFWNETEYNHKGYYRYTFTNDDYESDQMKYTSFYAKAISSTSINSSKTFPRIVPNTAGMGKMTTIQGNSNVALNPKMLAISEKSYDDGRNKFSFSSYTPTIEVPKPENIPTMINGAELSLKLYGADLNEFCEESNGNNCINHGETGNYHLYIDFWDNVDDIGNSEKIVRPTVTIPLVTNANEYNKRIEGLDYNKTYYFRVYAWLNKNNTKHFTQLFDAELSANGEFTTRDYYSFTTKGGELLQGIEVSSVLSTSSSAQYGDRMLNTAIKLQGYTINNYKFNYDITYVVCKDTATAETCIPYNETNSNMENDPRLLTNTITSNRLATVYNDKLPIDRDFEHDKEYKVYVYATYEYYENYADNRSASTVPKQVLLGARKPKLDKLYAPKFQSIERKAIIDENGNYAIEITPHVEDQSKVLLGGNYYIKLLSGSSVVGIMQVKEGNSYVTVGSGTEYLEHAFSIEDPNNFTQPVRITGLTENTPYSIVVYGTANLNNYDENIPVEERTRIFQTDPPISVYTTDESGVAFGNIEFTATKNSIVLTFLGGSNIGSIVRVEYTIGNWANYDAPNQRFYDETLTFRGEYSISENGFTSNENNDPQYTISPPGMDNKEGVGNPSIIKFYLSGEEEPITYIGAPVYKPSQQN